MQPNHLETEGKNLERTQDFSRGGCAEAMSQEPIVRNLLPGAPGELGVGRGVGGRVEAQLGLTQAGRTAAWLVKGRWMFRQTELEN